MGYLICLAYFHLKGFKVWYLFQNTWEVLFSPLSALTGKGTLQLSKTECVCVWGGRYVPFLANVKNLFFKWWHPLLAKSLRHEYEGLQRSLEWQKMTPRVGMQCWLDNGHSGRIDCNRQTPSNHFFKIIFVAITEIFQDIIFVCRNMTCLPFHGEQSILTWLPFIY